MEWLTKSKAKESGKALETTELTVSTSNAHKTVGALKLRRNAILNFQNGQRNVCDLSDRRLTLLPESLLCSDTFEVHQLNLRRNSLSSRGTNDVSGMRRILLVTSWHINISSCSRRRCNLAGWTTSAGWSPLQHWTYPQITSPPFLPQRFNCRICRS